MDYLILLDAYQPLVGEDEYAAAFSGTLDDCRAQTRHDGTYQTINKAGYVEISSEPKSLTGPTGSNDAGRIAGLQHAAGFVRLDPKQSPPVRGPLVLVAGGFALGAVTGFVVNHLFARASSKGPKA